MAIIEQKSAPTEAENPRAVMGGNQPPPAEQVVIDFQELIDANPDLQERMKTFLKPEQRDGEDEAIPFINRVNVTSEETMGRAAETVKQIRACMTLVTNSHKDAKEPFLKATRAVDAAKNNLNGPLQILKTKIEEKQSSYVRKMENERREREVEAQRKQDEIDRKERERLQKIEDERLAAIEAGKPAPPPPPPPPPPAPAKVEVAEKKRGPIRGAEGAVASTSMPWTSKVEDYAAAFAFVEDNEKVMEAIDKAVAAMVRAGKRKIPGCKIWQEAKVINR